VTHIPNVDKDTQRRPTLAEIVRSQHERIVSAWAQRVRELPPAGTLPKLMLRDEIDEVVAAIAERLERPCDRRVETSAPEPSERHAIQRLGIGFELAHLLQEYSALREVIARIAIAADCLDPGGVLDLCAAIDAVANRSIERFEAASQRILRAVNRVYSESLGAETLDALLHRLLRVLMETSPAVDSVAILLRGPDGRLRVRATEGLISERDLSFSLAIGEGFAGKIAAERRPILLRSAATDPLLRSDFFRERGIQALYGVPLEDDECIGVAHIASRTANEFTAEEMVLFRAMADRAAAVIVQQQLRADVLNAKQQLEAIFDGMPEAALLTNHGRVIELCNRMCKPVFGYEPEELVGLNVRVLYADEVEYQRFGELRRRPDKLGPLRVTCKRKDGTIFPGEVSGAPIRTLEGDTVGYLGIIRDLSAQEQQEHERDLFLGIIGHDLRNPLSVIRFAADAVLYGQETPNPQTVKMMARIGTTVDRMRALIDQLLEFARSQQGLGIPVRKTRTDLRRLCQEVIEELRVSRPARDIQLTVTGDPVGKWDPHRLRQLLENLITNALDHGQRDRPVTVRLQSEAEDTLIEVHNWNQGGPIPTQLQRFIFDPFRRAPQSSGRGVGLGLYIAQQIARAHDARIEVSSTADAGTSFRVRLPNAAA
jgi:PAS domain S-box-containing protein